MPRNTPLRASSTTALLLLGAGLSCVLAAERDTAVPVTIDMTMDLPNGWSGESIMNCGMFKWAVSGAVEHLIDYGAEEDRIVVKADGKTTTITPAAGDVSITTTDADKEKGVSAARALATVNVYVTAAEAATARAFYEGVDTGVLAAQLAESISHNQPQTGFHFSSIMGGTSQLVVNSFVVNDAVHEEPEGCCNIGYTPCPGYPPEDDGGDDDCEKDCAGDCNGGAVLDECGDCGGDGSSCAGDDGSADDCGNTGGDDGGNFEYMECAWDAGECGAKSDDWETTFQCVCGLGHESAEWCLLESEYDETCAMMNEAECADRIMRRAKTDAAAEEEEEEEEQGEEEVSVSCPICGDGVPLPDPDWEYNGQACSALQASVDAEVGAGRETCANLQETYASVCACPSSALSGAPSVSSQQQYVLLASLLAVLAAANV